MRRAALDRTPPWSRRRPRHRSPLCGSIVCVASRSSRQEAVALRPPRATTFTANAPHFRDTRRHSETRPRRRRVTMATSMRHAVLGSACALALLACASEARSEPDEPPYRRYFYQGRDYGSEALFGPASVFLNRGFDVLQLRPKTRDPFDQRYGPNLDNVGRSLADPLHTSRHAAPSASSSKSSSPSASPRSRRDGPRTTACTSSAAA